MNWKTALLAGLAALAMVACTRGGEGTGSPDSLVVYSGRSESLVGPLIDRFEGETGIRVSVKYGSTSEVAATILEEGGASPADVFFAQDPSGLGAVIDMLRPLPEDILGTVPQWARSPEGTWVGISGRARVVVYNTTALAEADLPSTMAAFVNSQWKGRIGWPPTNGSFQAMVTAMRAQWGEDRTREWLRGIQANEPTVYPKNTPTVAAAASGEIDIGFVNHYYLHRFIQENGEDFTARNHYLRGDGPGSVVLVAGSGILETASNPEGAERFIRFLLSKAAQQYFASETFEYPLVEGVVTSTVLPPLSELRELGIIP